MNNSFRFNTDTATAYLIREAALRQGRTVSDVIRRAVEQHVDTNAPSVIADDSVVVTDEGARRRSHDWLLSQQPAGLDRARHCRARRPLAQQRRARLAARVVAAARLVDITIIGTDASRYERSLNHLPATSRPQAPA
jgi:hypothetical protein